MPGLDDPYAPHDLYGAPGIPVPDPASLRWPWDPPIDAAPPPTVPAPPAGDPGAAPPAPQLPPQQPGLGLPQQAVDVAAPQLGPPIEADAPPAPAPPLPDIAPEQLFTPGAIPAAADTGPPPMYGPPISPSEQHYQQALADHPGQPLAIPDPAEQARAIGSLDAVGFAQLDAQHERDRAAFVEQRRRAATDAYIEGEKQALADRQLANRHAQERSDALIADATRIANTKVDPSGGVHGGRLIAGVLASIVGGLVQGRTGSAHNAGLDALMQTINNGIEAQKADLANQREGIGLRRGALADEYARTGHLQDAEDRVRLSSLKLADDMLASDAQNWDPRGTTAINNERLRRGINGQMAAVVEGQRQRDFENGLKFQNAAREQQIADEAARHNKVGENIDRQRLGIEAGKADAGKGPAFDPNQLAALNPGLPVPPIKMTLPEYEKWLSAQKVGQEAITAKRVNDPNERSRELAVPGMVDDTGSPALFRSKEVADKAATSKGTVDDVVRMADELVKMIEEHGYSSEYAKSPEWQRAQQTYSAILLKAKEEDHLGAMSGSDYDIEAKKVGTSDPTQIRSTVAGIKSFTHNLIEGYNSAARNQVALPPGRKLQRWEPARLDFSASAPSPLQTASTRLKAKPDVSRDDARAQAGHDWLAANPNLPRNDVGQVEWSADVRREYNAAADAAEAERKLVSPQQRRDLADLEARVRAGGSDGAIASDLLADVAKTAHSMRVRELAKQAISSSRSTTPIEPGATSEPVTLPSFAPYGGAPTIQGTP